MQKPLKNVVFAAAIIVPLVIFAIAPLYRDWAFLCSNTGSRKGYRVWRFGFKTSEWYSKSKLEEFMEAKYPADLSHNWISYIGTAKNALGIVVCRRHGRPGPIVNIPYDSFNSYVSSIDDEEKRKLYDILSSEDKQRIEDEISLILE